MIHPPRSVAPSALRRLDTLAGFVLRQHKTTGQSKFPPENVALYCQLRLGFRQVLIPWSNFKKTWLSVSIEWSASTSPSE